MLFRFLYLRLESFAFLSVGQASVPVPVLLMLGVALQVPPGGVVGLDSLGVAQNVGTHEAPYSHEFVPFSRGCPAAYTVSQCPFAIRRFLTR